MRKTSVGRKGIGEACVFDVALDFRRSSYIILHATLYHASLNDIGLPPYREKHIYSLLYRFHAKQEWYQGNRPNTHAFSNL